jgi:ATP-dependent Lhr-like helicase
LIQRVGRSGRKEGGRSNLFLYATDKWNLLQGLACWDLFETGYIEPVLMARTPYDILLHQMLSIVKQKSGCTREELLAKMKLNFAFKDIETDETAEILDHLVASGMFEVIGKEIIVGVDGEKIVNARDFYSVFRTEPNFKVAQAGRAIGEIPFSVQVKTDENILLAARIWKIIDVDMKAGRIEVIPAKDGKKPLFFGTGGTVHPAIRQKMFEILLEQREYAELDESAADALKDFRHDFKNFKVENPLHCRPVIFKTNESVFYTFQGTKINRSLNFLITTAGINVVYDEGSSTFEILTDQAQFNELLDELKSLFAEIDFHLENAVSANSAMINFSKWGTYLPVKYQVKILKERYFDFLSLENFIGQLILV